MLMLGYKAGTDLSTKHAEFAALGRPHRQHRLDLAQPTPWARPRRIDRSDPEDIANALFVIANMLQPEIEVPVPRT